MVTAAATVGAALAADVLRAEIRDLADELALLAQERQVLDQRIGAVEQAIDDRQTTIAFIERADGGQHREERRRHQ